MCNVHCVKRYCGACGDNQAAITVIVFRMMLFIILIVSPFCAICAVLNEFYQIYGDISIDTYYEIVHNDNINNYQLPFISTGSGASNLSVSIVKYTNIYTIYYVLHTSINDDYQ